MPSATRNTRKARPQQHNAKPQPPAPTTTPTPARPAVTPQVPGQASTTAHTVPTASAHTPPALAGALASLALPKPTVPPAGHTHSRRAKGPRYLCCVVCGWAFTQAGGQARPNCQAPNACARRVATGWLPGIGAPTAGRLQHNLGVVQAGTTGQPLLVPGAARQQQHAALAAGYLPGWQAS